MRNNHQLILLFSFYFIQLTIPDTYAVVDMTKVSNTSIKSGVALVIGHMCTITIQSLF